MLRLRFFKKIQKYSWALPYLPWTIYFNFHYLPFKQAIKLPILLVKPTLIKLGGAIKIAGKVNFGMIILGRQGVSIYRPHGIRYENNGGTILFKGKCSLDSGTSVSIGSKGVLEIGDNVVASAEAKIICYNSIKLDDSVRLGWEAVLMDTNFHKTIAPDGTPKGKPFAPIHIGSYTWLGFRCIVMPGAEVPHKCIVASNSMINKKYDIDPYSLLAGQPAVVKVTGIWRDFNNDEIIY